MSWWFHLCIAWLSMICDNVLSRGNRSICGTWSTARKEFVVVARTVPESFSSSQSVHTPPLLMLIRFLYVKWLGKAILLSEGASNFTYHWLHAPASKSSQVFQSLAMIPSEGKGTIGEWYSATSVFGYVSPYVGVEIPWQPAELCWSGLWCRFFIYEWSSIKDGGSAS